MLRFAIIVLVGLALCGPANAAAKKMPINLIGEWCYSGQENRTTTYKLPSWTEDGRCTQILSIMEEGFFGESRNCEPLNIRLATDVAHSGTAYTALVSALCRPDGPVTAGRQETLEFYRYKGTLTVTKK
jgi:hypothetical protein